ncbi:MAG: hypothetical protein H6737_04570 [Alphaproteobacteria bacterium]|nr:hypothetical protein [Alphaproteobacteria bacterium]
MRIVGRLALGLGLGLGVSTAMNATAARDEHVTVAVGGGAGGYRESCGPAHRYGTAAVGVEYARALSDTVDLTLEAQGSGAIDVALLQPPQDGQPAEPPEEPRVQGGGGLRLLVGFDHRYAAFSLGGAVGPLIFDGDLIPVFPAGRLRLGERSVFFLEGHVSDHFAGPSPGGFFQAGLGVGIPPRPRGAWNHPYVRGGVADAGYYLGGSYGVGSRVALDGFLSNAFDRDTWQVALGVRWRPPGRHPE